MTIMMILVLKYLIPKGYIGLTVFPFIFIKNGGLKTNTSLINHEKIHLQQQLELLIIPFFILYGLDFIIGLIYYRNWHLAYKNIIFEREAYAKEKDLDYLKSRPFWAFSKYV